MDETITREQAKTLLPQLVKQPTFSGTVIVTDNDKPILVIVGAEEYARLVEFRGQTVLRAAILREWERKANGPEWVKAFEYFEAFSQRLEGMSEEELDQTLNEAVSAVRAGAYACRAFQSG